MNNVKVFGLTAVLTALVAGAAVASGNTNAVAGGQRGALT